MHLLYILHSDSVKLFPFVYSNIPLKGFVFNLLLILKQYIRQVTMWGGGYGWSTHTSSSPAEFHTSQLVLHAINRVFDKHGFHNEVEFPCLKLSL